MGVVSLRIQKTAKGIFHRPGGRGVDMALDRRQMDDVLPDEVVGHKDALRVDVVEHTHRRAWLVAYPAHVLALEVVAHRDTVVLENRNVAVEVLALERIGHDRPVLHADLMVVAPCPQRPDRSLQLPRRRIRTRKREVPGDVVLENGRQARLQAALDTCKLDQPIHVVEHRLRARPHHGHHRRGCRRRPITPVCAATAVRRVQPCPPYVVPPYGPPAAAGGRAIPSPVPTGEG